MDEPKLISEREAIKREQRAAARMRCAVMHEMHFDNPGEGPCMNCRNRARIIHPLPKVSRPRVVAFQRGREYRVIDGRLQERVGDAGNWIGMPTCAAVPSVIAFIADLFANPTELIADDSDASQETGR